MPALNSAVSFTVRIEGLEKMQHAFLIANRTLGKELTAGLKRAAEPVRLDAERLAVMEIPNMTFLWSMMRVGIKPGRVYVAPRQRGVKSRGLARYRRPKFATKLKDEAMNPALKRNVAVVERIVGETLNKVSDGWEHA